MALWRFPISDSDSQRMKHRMVRGEFNLIWLGEGRSGNRMSILHLCVSRHSHSSVPLSLSYLVQHAHSHLHPRSPPTEWTTTPTFLTSQPTSPLACIHFTSPSTKTSSPVPLRITQPLRRKPTCLLDPPLLISLSHGLSLLSLVPPKTLAFTSADLGPSQRHSRPRSFSLPVASTHRAIIASSYWSPWRLTQISLRTRSRLTRPPYPPWPTPCWRLIPALTILRNRSCIFLDRSLTRDTS